MVEAPVNFEKKSERLTLHGVTGFIPHVLHVLHVLPVLQSASYTHTHSWSIAINQLISAHHAYGVSDYISVIYTHTHQQQKYTSSAKKFPNLIPGLNTRS